MMPFTLHDLVFMTTWLEAIKNLDDFLPETISGTENT